MEKGEDGRFFVRCVQCVMIAEKGDTAVEAQKNAERDFKFFSADEVSEPGFYCPICAKGGVCEEFTW